MGNTPILIASRKGNEEILKVLIKKGADINAQDKVLTTTITTISTTTTTALVFYFHATSKLLSTSFIFYDIFRWDEVPLIMHVWSGKQRLLKF